MQIPVYLRGHTVCSVYFDHHLVMYTVSPDHGKKDVLVKYHFQLCVCLEQRESYQSAVIYRWINVGVCGGGIAACTNTEHDWLKTH